MNSLDGVLPEEIIQYCFSFFRIRDFINASMVCSRWYHISQAAHPIWKQLFIRKFGEIALPQSKPDSWRDHFRRTCSGSTDHVGNVHFEPHTITVTLPKESNVDFNNKCFVIDFHFIAIGNGKKHSVIYVKNLINNSETTTHLPFYCKKWKQVGDKLLAVNDHAVMQFEIDKDSEEVTFVELWKTKKPSLSFDIRKDTIAVLKENKVNLIDLRFKTRRKIPLDLGITLSHVHVTKEHVLLIGKLAILIYAQNGTFLQKFPRGVLNFGWNDHALYYFKEQNIFCFNFHACKSTLFYKNSLNPNFVRGKVQLFVTDKYLVYGHSKILLLISLETSHLTKVELGFEARSVKEYGKIFICSSMKTGDIAFVDLESGTVIRKLKLHSSKFKISFNGNQLIARDSQEALIFDFSQKADDLTNDKIVSVCTKKRLPRCHLF